MGSVVVIYPNGTETPLNCVAAQINLLKQTTTENSPFCKENKEIDWRYEQRCAVFREELQMKLQI